MLKSRITFLILDTQEKKYKKIYICILYELEMNRIIVIGNGFDKAHGLATGYKDFIDSYWKDFWNNIYGEYSYWQMRTYGVVHAPRSYEDDFVFFDVFNHKSDRASIPKVPQPCLNSYGKVMGFLSRLNEKKECAEDYKECRFTGSVRLIFKNKFFEHVSNRCSLTNWVDIENEYYEKLKDLLEENDTLKRNEKVRKLNQEFKAIKKSLETYLTRIVEQADLKPIDSIQEAFDTLIDFEEVAHSKQDLFFRSIMEYMAAIDEDVTMDGEIEEDPSYHRLPTRDEMNKYYLKEKLKIDSFRKVYCKPYKTLFLNFNYTSLADSLYESPEKEVINIHGQLNNEHNPMIFGYGDELDEDYKRIEKLQDNDFLENVKSVCYNETSNYRNLLGFIESAPYQMFVMGHSCGNSDCTLLNTLFEHRNCISVKVYYHQREDGSDDYSQLVRNLSRNFNNKTIMRDMVVNKEKCQPLVPIVGKEANHPKDGKK